MGDWTKGPYISSRSKWTEDGEYDFCISAGGKVIAETFGRVAEGEEGLRPAEANARLFAAAPDLAKACRASHAWAYAEHHGLGSFDQRSILCAHAESLTAIAVAKLSGDTELPEYKGSKRMIVWPHVILEESSIAEADALVESAFEHERAAREKAKEAADV